MKRFSVTIIVLALTIPGCLVLNAGLHFRAKPPRTLTSLTQFVEWRPSIDEFRVADVAGERHLIAYGPAGRFLPSGPGAYVFDTSGKLVDWSADIGDDSRFDDKWNAQRTRGAGQRLTRSEVAIWPTSQETR